jgi:hypothetical protein
MSAFILSSISVTNYISRKKNIFMQPSRQDFLSEAYTMWIVLVLFEFS